MIQRQLLPPFKLHGNKREKGSTIEYLEWQLETFISGQIGQTGQRNSIACPIVTEVAIREANDNYQFSWMVVQLKFACKIDRPITGISFELSMWEKSFGKANEWMR